MADQAQLFAVPPEHDIERLREHEADLTPAGVVDQFFAWLCDGVSMRPFDASKVEEILDPAAGAGVYGMVARKYFPRARFTAIELREEERPHLERWYDEVHIGNALDVLARFAAEGRRFGVISTNPAFTLFGDYARLGKQLLVQDPAAPGVLALLYLTQWGQAREHWPLITETRPSAQVRVGGRVGFRGRGNGSDARDYSHYVWSLRQAITLDEEGEVAGVSWDTHQLPPLPKDARTWTVRPGTEERR